MTENAHTSKKVTDTGTPTSLQQAREMGLADDEYERIISLIGRTPNITELGIFSAMWSEHCSYKSSRRWLKTLPTSGAQVIQGPGENAGAVDIGDGWAAIFKIESHNHPSFIEPYQGAATGVGGILRDVFTMGARPVALMNALRFGAPEHPLTRHLLGGVVAGIGGYGNCIGIPTVGGEVEFDNAYNGNILVNAMAVGLARSDRIFRSAASGPGNPVIYIGAKTGRDGIHGATMASAEFSEEAEARRPTVQVGDPFAGKLLMEASLELMASDAVVAIQDMGAAGLTSSSVEMASKGGLGMEIDLDQVPLREDEMSAYEIMLSESQERMLVVIKPDATEQAKAIFDKWDLDFATIGKVTDTGRLVLLRNGATAADLPLEPLVDNAPEYDRPWTATPQRPSLKTAEVEGADDLGLMLKRMLATPALASRRWIWEQYDRHVMADTVSPAGGDAALVRVHGSHRGIAITTDCSARYIEADPEGGTIQAVAEAARNISATGALPLAITNNLNFGNPEKPEIMGQIVGAIKGMAIAADALNTPVVSGNVSLYNETDGKAIKPAPVIGMVGRIDDVSKAAGIAISEAGLALFVVGQAADCHDGWLGCSIYAETAGHAGTFAPPPVSLEDERRHGVFIRQVIANGLVSAVHDLGDGGLLVGLAEMLMAGSRPANSIGASVIIPATETLHGWAFGEDQGRYLVACRDAEAFSTAANAAEIAIQHIGTSDDSGRLTLPGSSTISIEDYRHHHESFLAELMA